MGGGRTWPLPNELKHLCIALIGREGGLTRSLERAAATAGTRQRGTESRAVTVGINNRCLSGFFIAGPPATMHRVALASLR